MIGWLVERERLRWMDESDARSLFKLREGGDRDRRRDEIAPDEDFISHHRAVGGDHVALCRLRDLANAIERRLFAAFTVAWIAKDFDEDVYERPLRCGLGVELRPL